MKMAVFRTVAPCGVVVVSHHFRGVCCLHRHGDESAPRKESLRDKGTNRTGLNFGSAGGDEGVGGGGGRGAHGEWQTGVWPEGSLVRPGCCSHISNQFITRGVLIAQMMEAAGAS
jgi:hypothetical protein